MIAHFLCLSSCNNKQRSHEIGDLILKSDHRYNVVLCSNQKVMFYESGSHILSPPPESPEPKY